MMSYWKLIFCLTAITLVYSDHSASTEPENLITKDSTFSTQVDGKGEKVDVKVYYGVFCGGCIEFHAGPLNDTMAILSAYIDLKTYPYGNARRTVLDGEITIECQMGPQECYGNKLHGCAIDILNNITLSFFFNSCVITRGGGWPGSGDEDVIRCGKLMKIDPKPIIDCAKGQKGDDILEYNGEETDKTNHRWTPWILINGELYKDRHAHFMQKICSLLAHPPPECKKQL